MKVVAISGWKGSGKDEAAKFLINQQGFTKLSFADLLKDMVSKQYSIPRHYFDDREYKEAPLTQYPVLPKDDFTLNLAKFMVGEFRDIDGRKPADYYVDSSGSFMGLLNNNAVQLYWTPRALCILEGSVKRSVASDYWVQKVIDTAFKLCRNPMNPEDMNFVISDLRYKSEVQQLREAFGKDLLTVRINRFEASASTDPSERDLDNSKFDLIIDNTSSLEDFINKLKEQKWN